MDTAFYRIDNGLPRWFDVDLPPVIEPRKKHIPETDRSRCISASLLDPEGVRKNGQNFEVMFFFASGGLLYFTKAELRRFFFLLVEAFPGG